MRADVVFLPSHLSPEQLRGRVAVVIDVLRATTTMTAALAWGAREIRIFPDIHSASDAAKNSPGVLLCGEVNCLKPPGFDLGNSPGDFNVEHAGSTLYMSTTNGTRAILAARAAVKVLIGALVNTKAVAEHLHRLHLDFILLCAGTNGRITLEDVIGAGAILAALGNDIHLESDAAHLALRAFSWARHDLPGALRQSSGGINLIKAGLEEDIDYAARIDSDRVVGVLLDGDPIRIGLLSSRPVG